MKVAGKTVDSTDENSLEGASKKESELNKEFFTSLGYTYGTAAATPWKGDGMPVLYFEDEVNVLALSKTSLTLSPNKAGEVAVTVYGVPASEIEVTSADATVAEVAIAATDEHNAVITVNAKKEGQTSFTVTAGGRTRNCTVTVAKSEGESGVSEATAEGAALWVMRDKIVADQAVAISLYNLAGQKVAEARSSVLNVAGVSAGVYVVLTTDSFGHTTSTKVVIR